MGGENVRMELLQIAMVVLQFKKTVYNVYLKKKVSPHWKRKLFHLVPLYLSVFSV